MPNRTVAAAAAAAAAAAVAVVAAVAVAGQIQNQIQGVTHRPRRRHHHHHHHRHHLRQVRLLDHRAPTVHAVKKEIRAQVRITPKWAMSSTWSLAHSFNFQLRILSNASSRPRFYIPTHSWQVTRSGRKSIGKGNQTQKVVIEFGYMTRFWLGSPSSVSTAREAPQVATQVHTP